MYLAAHKGQKSTAANIAKAYDISFHHVAKAAQWLTRQGYITSERGRSGGLSLALPQDQINIGHIVREAEHMAGTPLVDCMRKDGGQCKLRSACGLTGALARAQSAFYDVLSDYTLADIGTESPALTQLLQSHTA